MATPAGWASPTELQATSRDRRAVPTPRDTARRSRQTNPTSRAGRVQRIQTHPTPSEQNEPKPPRSPSHGRRLSGGKTNPNPATPPGKNEPKPAHGPFTKTNPTTTFPTSQNEPNDHPPTFQNEPNGHPLHLPKRTQRPGEPAAPGRTERKPIIRPTRPARVPKMNPIACRSSVGLSRQNEPKHHGDTPKSADSRPSAIEPMVAPVLLTSPPRPASKHTLSGLGTDFPSRILGDVGAFPRRLRELGPPS